MEFAEAQAVRINIVRTSTLIIDNVEWLFNQVNEAIDQLSGFEHCDAGDDCEAGEDHDSDCLTMEQWPTVREVGDAVTETLSEWIHSATTQHETLRTLIIDLMDLSDAQLIEMFGQHYYPEESEKALRDAGLWLGKQR